MDSIGAICSMQHRFKVRPRHVYVVKECRSSLNEQPAHSGHLWTTVIASLLLAPNKTALSVWVYKEKSFHHLTTGVTIWLLEWPWLTLMSMHFLIALRCKQDQKATVYGVWFKMKTKITISFVWHKIFDCTQ